MRKRTKFSSPPGKNMSSRVRSPASLLCIMEVKIIWWLATKNIKLTRLRVQVFTAWPKSMDPKCVKGAPELLDLKRYSECRNDGDVGGIQGGQMANDLSGILDDFKLCMILCLE